MATITAALQLLRADLCRRPRVPVYHLHPACQHRRLPPPREESRRHQLRRRPPDSLGYLPPCQHHRRSLQEKPRQQRPSRRPPLISRSRLHKGKPAGEAPLSGPPACLLLRLRTRSLAKPVFSPIPQLIVGRISPNPLLPYQVVPSRSDGQSNLTDSGPPSTSKLTVLYKMWCSSLRQD